MLKDFLKSDIQLTGRQKTALSITLLYAAITFLLCLKHEMWSDELNVWMAIKHYSFPELVKFSSEAGNPIFFFLPLFPFIKLGASAHFIQFFCWACSVFAVFLLNFFAPFGTATKLLITFGAPMLYHYSVMARCYSVLPPLMFLTAMLYPCACAAETDASRKENSIVSNNAAVILYACCIAAIACTHIITFVFAAGLAALFVYENLIKNRNRSRYGWAAAVIMAAGLLAVTAQTFYALSATSFFVRIPVTAVSVWQACTSYFASMTDGLGDGLFGYNRTGNILSYLSPAAAFFFALSIVFLYKYNRFFSALVIGTFLFYLYITVTRWGGAAPHRIYIFLIVLISLLWAAKSKYDTERKIENCAGREYKLFKAIEYLTALIMLLTVPTGIEISAEDWKKPFSSGHDISRFIKSHIPADKNTAIISSSVMIAYYLNDRPVYYEYEKPLSTIPIRGNAITYNIGDFLNKYNNMGS